MVPLTQPQPHNIVDRVAIRVMELNEMHQRIEEKQKKNDNSKKPGTAGVRLEDVRLELPELMLFEISTLKGEQKDMIIKPVIC